ncbi:ParB family protein (plasmid) [Stanieria cyanosphaera PCC 7437]|uniref:ParB family protein n=1 Tax=Stanieria cyanosphaera (strain ATCC 29371 / PCC 7437) TaxID=111780 RepID=K9Y1U2_STAC7|nr:ParB/RepB/Spo0J family partition protein [Stanieria cyanosphaera]AFZ38299.1 ParB family protein [Stanieria cyanosphaera PCC 7437]
MSPRKSPNLNNFFSGAKQSQQLSEAEQEISYLKAEIEKLRASGSQELESQLSELRKQLASKAGVLDVALEEIQPNKEQPRQTFLAESIEAMAHSLATYGQLEPIILIREDAPSVRGENLIIFDGERRWRSAKKLGWQSIKAVLMEQPEDLHKKALLTSLHREDLNPLDKAEAIVRELSFQTELNASEIPRTVATAVRRLNKYKQMNRVVELLTVNTQEQSSGLSELNLDENEKLLLSLLLNLQLNPASVDANIFTMLSLAPDLKEAIRNLGLKGVHALALNKLSAKNLKISERKAKSVRVEKTKQVTLKKLSAAETRKLVNEVLEKYAGSEAKSHRELKTIVRAKVNLQHLSDEVLASADASQLKALEEVLRQKLAAIETVLKIDTPHE